MAIGPTIRKFLPPSAEKAASRLYRSIFVDLDKVALILAQTIPKNAAVLDIGGGDGDLLNHLFARRTDVRVDMVDIAPSVGRFVSSEYADRIRLSPNTAIEDHLTVYENTYDVAIISDVMHHIPLDMRADFLRSVVKTLRAGGSIFVKDVEPGHFVSWLGLYCDKYLSGDRGVALISADRLRDLAQIALPGHRSTELGLIAKNRPNYLIRLDFG
jgi:2-polyprenyl-3-methyl-5-hydroxy-6-metoxy-1,4-benzoquinol methylase